MNKDAAWLRKCPVAKVAGEEGGGAAVYDSFKILNMIFNMII